VMYGTALAKYEACLEAQTVLGSTGTAQLWHVVERGKPIRFEHLEQIRSLL
jgi:hypothetical protein